MAWEHAQSKVEIFKTPLLLNCEFKCYMEHLIGKLPSISTASKNSKKSKKIIAFITACPKLQKVVLALLVLYGLR
jgi:hypothetical protein